MTRGTIVFDLDGTLIDTAPDIRRIANAVLAGVGADDISLTETHDFIGQGTAQFVTKMMAARGMAADADTHARMHAEFQAVYTSATDLSTPYPGMIKALQKLADAGFALGVCTNKPIAPANAVLAHFDLTKYFGAVAGGDSQPTRKPDAAPLLQVFDRLGADARRLYVGDSEVDADTAVNACIPFALFTEGYRKTPISQIKHAYAFDAYSDLPEIVHRHFA